ncbi:MAG: hypothetical protein AABX03_01465 [Nanoarchaeota archaeon]
MQGVVNLRDISSRIQARGDFGFRVYSVFYELYDGASNIERSNGEFEPGFQEFLRFVSENLRVTLGFTLDDKVKLELEYGLNGDENFIPKVEYKGSVLFLEGGKPSIRPYRVTGNSIETIEMDNQNAKQYHGLIDFVIKALYE